MSSYISCDPIDEEGWCEWQLPVMKNYKMACCDCGLVHTMEFKVMKVISTDNKGNHKTENVGHEYRVLMRGKRNNRSTAQMRRLRKSTKPSEMPDQGR